jgi:hypothetical protein
MIDPTPAVQPAIFQVLTSDAGLVAWFAALRDGAADKPRVYDRIPADRTTGKVTATFPFIELGEILATPDETQCDDGAQVFCTLHIWSRAVGKTEARALAALVATALDAAIEIEGHQVVVHEIEAIRDAAGGDGLTTHRVVEVRYETLPTA